MISIKYSRANSRVATQPPDRAREYFTESSVQFGLVRYSSVQFGSVRSSSVQFGLVRSNSVQFGSIRFSSV
jgi:hypothetical protein